MPDIASIPTDELKRMLGGGGGGDLSSIPTDELKRMLGRETPVDEENKTSPVQSMLLRHENLLSGAEQRSNPNPEAYKTYLGNATEDELGDLYIKGPNGELTPTDQSKHVAIRDPRDNQVKVFARSEDTNEPAVVGVSRVLAPGLATGPVSSRLLGGVRAAQPEGRLPVGSIAPDLEQLDAATNAGYAAANPRNVGSAAEGDAVRASIEANLRNEGHYRPNSPEASRVFEIIQDLPGTAPRGQFIMRGLESAGYPEAARATAQVADYDSVRKALLRIKNPEASDAVRRAVTGIDDYLQSQNVPEILQARGDAAAAFRSRDLQRALERGLANNAAAASGGNTENAIRQSLKSLMLNPQLMRGWTPDEQAALRQIVFSPPAREGLRYAGNLLAGGGGIAAAVTGWKTLGIAPVAGRVLKWLGGKLAQEQAAHLDEMLRLRSPLARQLNDPLEQFGNAAARGNVSPNAQNLSRLMNAANNLSTNLRDAGVNITKEQLLKAIHDDQRESTGRNQ